MAQNYPSPGTCGNDGVDITPPSLAPVMPYDASLAICTNPSYIKYLNVNIHYILKDDGTGNFNEYNDGNGNAQNDGFVRAERVIDLANAELAAGTKMWLPSFNTTPAVSSTTRYVIKGVYFHRNTVMYNKPLFNWDVHTLYAVNKEKEINIYMMPTNSSASGVAKVLAAKEPTDFAVKVDAYDTYLIQPEFEGLPAMTVNHEIGHLLTLKHTWASNDGCNDTPLGFLYQPAPANPNFPCPALKNANCWTFNPNLEGCMNLPQNRPCDDWSKISNNIMDYNEFYPHAYSPCQVAAQDNHLATTFANEYINSCNGCMPSNAFFYTKPSYPICLPIIMNGTASFKENKYLFEICRVANANSSTCIDGYFSSTWKTGEVGKIDLKNYYTFQANKFYKVKLTVDNTDCPTSTIYEKIFATTSCTTNPVPVIRDVHLIGNPTYSQSLLRYTTDEAGILNIILTEANSGESVMDIRTNTPREIGEYEENLDLSSLQQGIYQVIILFNGETVYKNVIKL